VYLLLHGDPRVSGWRNCYLIRIHSLGNRPIARGDGPFAFADKQIAVKTMSTEIAIPVKETKAQRAERLKLEKNPWECFEEIRQFARQGLSAVLDAWIKTYFRWWGVYI
jgi:hypothetical protein